MVKQGHVSKFCSLLFSRSGDGGQKGFLVVAYWRLSLKPAKRAVQGVMFLWVRSRR